MARNGRPKSALVLSPAEQAALLRQSRARRDGRAAALRAQVILACSEGRSNRDVAALFALAEHTVGKWRRRFVALRLDGLCDRRSRQPQLPRVIPGHLQKLHELAVMLSRGAPFGPWSLGQALGGAASCRLSRAAAN